MKRNDSTLSKRHQASASEHERTASRRQTLLKMRSDVTPYKRHQYSASATQRTSLLKPSHHSGQCEASPAGLSASAMTTHRTPKCLDDEIATT